MNPPAVVERRTKAERRHLRLVVSRPSFDREAPSSEETEPYDRPRTRGECVSLERPCPFVGCRHHLYLDVRADGRIKRNFPNVEPEDMRVSCSLDVADLGGVSRETVGEQMNMTREGARQIEVAAAAKLTDGMSEYR